MDYENASPVQDIGAWYNLFSGNNTVEEPKEIKPSVTNALGELLIYSAQASAYANFINVTMGMIEQDIKRDIMEDAAPVSAFAGPNAPAMTPPVQPLATVVANRQKLVEYSEKLAAVIKSIDSILARVKIKEEQQA